MAKDQQHDETILNTNSSEQILATQNRSTKKVPMTNSIIKSAATTPTNVRSDASAAVTQNSASNEIDPSAPQSIAYVAGRKFIMVPKTGKTQTSPDSINGKQATKSS